MFVSVWLGLIFWSSGKFPTFPHELHLSRLMTCSTLRIVQGHSTWFGVPTCGRTVFIYEVHSANNY